MNRYIFTLMLLGSLLLTACNKKSDTAQVDTTSATKTTATNTTAVTPPPSPSDSGMKMTGQMSKDMAMMNQMMMQQLGPADQNYDDRFIRLMTAHHEEAIVMAKDALNKSSKPEIKKIAQDMLTEQNKEIDQMKQWDQQWYSHAPAMTSDILMMKQMAQELGHAGPDYEDDFIDGMIPHHEGAIAMAKDALAKSSHAEIKTLAQNIIATQQKEIGQMKALRMKWYAH